MTEKHARFQGVSVRARVVVVDHYDSYTWNLVHLIASVTGVLPDVVQHDKIRPESVLAYDHVVLSAGPGHPARRSDFSVGHEVLLAGIRPVLGVCLGMQGLVMSYGGSVERVEPAHGQLAAVDHDGASVFAGLPPRLRVVRYHSLAATVVPDALEVTATCPGAAGSPPVVMGVRHRNLPLHGVQFHPESVLSEHGARLVGTFLECR